MEVLNLEIGKLRQATDLLNTALAAWNLPAAIEDVGGKNLVPQSLLDKSQAMKDKGGIARIDSMMAELPPLMQRNADILNESKRMLSEEEASDTEIRANMKGMFFIFFVVLIGFGAWRIYVIDFFLTLSFTSKNRNLDNQ